MLNVYNTENNLGVKIEGDYYDLYDLHHAIKSLIMIYQGYYTRYVENLYKNQKIEEDDYSYGQDQLAEIYDNILDFAYDIKDTYFGSYGYEFYGNGSESIVNKETLNEDEQVLKEKGSNGNLYYCIDILYPWAIYYLIYLTKLEKISYTNKTLKQYGNDELNYKNEISIITHFTNEICLCLRDLLGPEKAENLSHIVDYFSSDAYSFCQYVEAFCHYYCNDDKQGKGLQGDMVLAFIFSFLDYYDVPEKDFSDKDYQEAKKNILDKTGKEFLDEDCFVKDLGQYISNHHLVDSDIDGFIDQYYGAIDWEKIDY